MSQQSVNLKEKSVMELKALAYDLSSLVNNYTQILQAVNEEIGFRSTQEKEQQNKAEKNIPQSEGLQAKVSDETGQTAKVVKIKKKEVFQES